MLQLETSIPSDPWNFSKLDSACLWHTNINDPYFPVEYPSELRVRVWYITSFPLRQLLLPILPTMKKVFAKLKAKIGGTNAGHNGKQVAYPIVSFVMMVF